MSLNKPVSKQQESSQIQGDIAGAQNETAAIAAKSSNPFDLSKLKLSQDFEGLGGGVKKILTTIPVKKPNKQAFIRAFGDEDYQLTTAVIELKGEQDGTYLVSPDLRDELLDEVQFVHLATCVDRHGNYFLWPIKITKSGERSNPWNESAAIALKAAETKWVRITPNMTAGHYDVFEAVGKIPDPALPPLTMQQVLEIAFRGKFIDSAEHAVIRKLRGEL